MNCDRNKRKAIALTCCLTYEMFMCDSDEEETDINVKVENYAEEIVPYMTNKQFQLHFRLTAETFEDMLYKLHSVDNRSCIVTAGHPKIALDKACMITIWYLANLESFSSVACRFGISKSTCWDVLYKTCTLLLQANKKFKIISWPLQERAASIMQNFHTRYQIPGVVGAIDGSHIRIIAPKEHHTSYLNRKSYHSVLLQAVCDDNKLFLDVYAGSIHDWTLFKKSDLCERINNNTISFLNNGHLIGDLAYTLSVNLLVGFKDYGNLTVREKNYNLTLSKSRAIIENALALLKGRFRRLKYLETVRLDLISLLIVSACVLHNMCIMCGDTLEDLLDIAGEVEEQRLHDPHNFENGNENRTCNDARTKRLDIVNSLPLIIRNNQ